MKKLTFYFEFNTTHFPYYALIQVECTQHQKETGEFVPHKEAGIVYEHVVAKFEDGEHSGDAKLLTKSEAFMQYAYSIKSDDLTLKQAIQDFEESSNTAILIDGCLL